MKKYFMFIDMKTIIKMSVLPTWSIDSTSKEWEDTSEWETIFQNTLVVKNSSKIYKELLKLNNNKQLIIKMDHRP